MTHIPFRSVQANIFDWEYSHLCHTQDEEGGEKWERGVSPPAVDAESEEPVDFTIKNEQGSPNPEAPEPDMTDMAAFIASATAAVRNAGQGNYQV